MALSKIPTHMYTAPLGLDSTGSQLFKRNDGTYITRPHFEAVNPVTSPSTMNHNWSTSSPTSFNSDGVFCCPFFSAVHGMNTTGFTTSTTRGSSKYQVPVTGIYEFSASMLMSVATAAHVDTTYYITDVNDTFSDIAGARPWDEQHVAFTDNTGHGTRGFTRSDPANNQTSAFGSTVTIKLFEGQHVRPAVALNSAVSGGGILVSRHGYFHGILIGT